MALRHARRIPLLTTGLAATLLAAAVVMAAAPATPSAAPAAAASAPAVDQNGPKVVDVYKNHFLIGTAADLPGGFSEAELNLVKENFNIVTPENCMKPAPVHPEEGRWAFERPDALMKWAGDNKLAVWGHTLVWHAQTNGWFFEGGDKETVVKRLKDHITTLVGRYKGKIQGWDVVNEAINDGGGRGGAAAAGGENLRSSPWLQNVGPEFLTLAFKFAHEADPDVKLYYNDYNIESGAKHEASMVLLRRLIKDGAPIHGVGIQGHWSTSGNGPPYAAIDRAIANYASLGLKVAITELDVTIQGTSGGQLGPAGGDGGAGGGGGGRRGRGTAPATVPGAGVFLMDEQDTFFTAAPAGPGAGGFGAGGPAATGPGAGTRGAGRAGRGGGGGGAGGRGGGGAPPSAEALKAQADAYAKLFAIFIKYNDAVERVTFWGVNDTRSWRRGQNPLIFDGNNQRKSAYISIVDALLKPNPDLLPR